MCNVRIEISSKTYFSNCLSSLPRKIKKHIGKMGTCFSFKLNLSSSQFYRLCLSRFRCSKRMFDAFFQFLFGIQSSFFEVCSLIVHCFFVAFKAEDAICHLMYEYLILIYFFTNIQIF